MSSDIETLAKGILNSREIAVATRFAKLMEDSGQAIEPLILDIMPVFYHGDQTLSPRTIYRTLMYLHIDAHNGDSRGMIFMTGQHIEGCLHRLVGGNKSLGAMVHECLKKGTISLALAKRLLLFDKVVNIPSKHMASIRELESRIDRRTFSYLDAAFAFMIMRKLSKALFDITKVIFFCAFLAICHLAET